jgi:hypothetical protein
VSDTDGDGLTDYYEVVNLLNPTDVSVKPPLGPAEGCAASDSERRGAAAPFAWALAFVLAIVGVNMARKRMSGLVRNRKASSAL